MPIASQSSPDREANLRRVAIVLSSLPPAVAAKLLSTVDADAKQTLRRTITTLSDVDPLERQRALRAFKGSLQNNPHATQNTAIANQNDDEFVRSTHDVGSKTSETQHPLSRVEKDSREAQPALSTPLSFLGDVEDSMLVGVLSEEHPQAVALVLASISPAQAARVLPQLNATLQQDTLHRISQLGDFPSAAIEDLADHLRSRIEKTRSTDRSSNGQRALSAILAALPKTNQEAKNASTADTASTQPTADRSEMTDSIVSLRVAPETVESQPQAISAKAPSTDQQNTVLHSTDAIHSYLTKLNPKVLCQALGRVGTNHALLTLCGLPSSVAEAALRELPRAQAKQVRTQLASLVSLKLREIDEAKALVAEAALQIEKKRSQPTSMAA